MRCGPQLASPTEPAVGALRFHAGAADRLPLFEGDGGAGIAVGELLGVLLLQVFVALATPV